jgi:DNA repair protein RecN (Recombination protein N)
MLEELSIRDFAIIEELSLSLNPGFVVFTGETGAGKSIIIDAVEMLLGGRADTDMVRSGAEVAWIEGTFHIEPDIQVQLHPILEREGLLDDASYVTLGREIRLRGRNICRVNGRTVSLGVMKEIGEWLVDVHGQSEHLSLLRVREHLHLLDRFAKIDQLLSSFAEVYQKTQVVRQELANLRQLEQEASQRADLLAFQINEIESAALRDGEDVDLLGERTRLANAEQLATLTKQALAALDEALHDRETVTDLLGRAAHTMEGLAKVDTSLQGTQAELQSMLEQTSDIAQRLRDYLEGVEFNPRRLDEVEERLGMIRSLQRKYGDKIPDVLAHAEEARQELENITHAEERLKVLEAEESKSLKRLGELGSSLSEARHKAADQLRQAIEDQLGDLRMEGAQFGVGMEWQDDPQGVPVGDRQISFSPSGLDMIEFLVAPNPGEGLKPLAKIASGGETSRLMLGLKSVLVQADRTPTLIFDEIDQGIGGRVGAIVGQKLWGLAKRHQVLCVTHLPQLAAYGDQHYKVEKQVDGGRTITLARPLTDPESIPELALMLGGVTEPNLESAADLLRQAMEDKSITQDR